MVRHLGSHQQQTKTKISSNFQQPRRKSLLQTREKLAFLVSLKKEITKKIILSTISFYFGPKLKDLRSKRDFLPSPRLQPPEGPPQRALLSCALSAFDEVAVVLGRQLGRLTPKASGRWGHSKNIRFNDVLEPPPFRCFSCF